MLMGGFSLLMALPAFGAGADCDASWPRWQGFAGRFIQADGRVINQDMAGQESVSEAQAYALFFALVANDRQAFERLLVWTRDNLAGGDLTARLPAWRWGKKEDGSWGVLDDNNATDADLWLAYTLLEAGRLWSVSAYSALGRLLIDRIKSSSVVELKGVGPMLLPGAKGFRPEDILKASGQPGLWRFNPSYLPLPVLRRLAQEDRSGPWTQMAGATVSLIRAAAPHGVAPDWIVWSENEGFRTDPLTGAVGSFDAIRTYLWAGMTDREDPLGGQLLGALRGMERLAAQTGVPPQVAHAGSGAGDGIGPAGFSAALIPYLKVRRQLRLSTAQNLRVVSIMDDPAANRANTGGGDSRPPGYYDYVLALFGQGWFENRFRFDKHGRLLPGWRGSCQSTRNDTSLR